MKKLFILGICIFLCFGQLRMLSKYKMSSENAAEESDNIDIRERQYTIDETEDGHRITLYDKQGNIVDSTEYPSRSWVNEITEDVIEIVVSVGSPARYVFYYDKEKARISDTYFNAILIDNKYIAFMESNEALILTDLFDEGILYKRIVRDFSKSAVASDAIISIELLDEKSIRLNYLKGEQYSEESEVILLTNDTDVIAGYYGYYQITQFYPTIYYGNVKYDCLPEQEADMMLGRIVIMEPEQLVTYDSERRLGTREGRDGFGGNYIIKEYAIENPQYECKEIESELIESFPKFDLNKKLEKVITIPQLCSPYGTQYYYTLSDADQMILYSTLSNQYFLLEKMDQKQERKMLEPFSDVQKKKLLEEIYGIYEIIQFLPTKFYPAKDSSGYDILPLEEADMMIGQEITIKEDFFNTYDNKRRPNSWIADRLEDGFWIAEVKIEHSEYCVERKYRKDIYGLRDNMLPDQVTQQEYIEIDVFPGYYAGDNILPQLFVTENRKIIMYAMGEYFLLKKK